MTDYQEVLTFLRDDSRPFVKFAAVTVILRLTGSIEGRKSLYNECPEIFHAIIDSIGNASHNFMKNSYAVLINVSSDEEGSSLLLSKNLKKTKDQILEGGSKLLLSLFETIFNPNAELADHASVILANLSRHSAHAECILSFLEENNSKFSLNELVSIFTQTNFNKAKCTLDYLAFFFANCSQITDFRRKLLKQDANLILLFFPFTNYKESVIRRNGVIALLKNCCFDWENHDWLLSPDVDILPRLLLPLAGPEQFDDEDNEKLPLDLQYLSEDKEREVEPSIRKSLLEAVLQLCATKKCRSIIRNANTYIILRELHKWEKDEEVLLACENVIDILIRTEDEIGVDNLKEVEVPEDLKTKFEKLDLQNSNNLSNGVDKM